MINRISELPLWGPEEQIQKFISEHLDNDQLSDIYDKMVDSTTSTINSGLLTDEERAACRISNRTVTQMRIANLDEIFQKQLIWSYGRPNVDDAYFYWDWCPDGKGTQDDPRWKIVAWEEYYDNLLRDIDRPFDYTKFKGVTNTGSPDEMPIEYDSMNDYHAKIEQDVDDPTNLDQITLRHNIMRSYIEVSEWLGDAALEYGSHNGYVSRKMSLRWLFDAIRALINWKMQSQDKYAEVDIHPLDVGTRDADGNLVFTTDSEQMRVYEGFLTGDVSVSTQGISYSDIDDLDQSSGRCSFQERKRARHPDRDGVLKVRGNEFHYGERADFYTHNSFIGECRFFHNARFLGQTTFDKEINGTAMRARWSGDLAEMYESDSAYEPGTLVMFGGEKEITCSDGKICNAIVTEKPGVILNGQDQPGKNMVGIALTGMVPVNIVGRVCKFDKLVPSRKFPGRARRKHWYDWFRKPMGIALEDSHDGKVKCVTKMKF